MNSQNKSLEHFFFFLQSYKSRNQQIGFIPLYTLLRAVAGMFDVQISLLQYIKYNMYRFDFILNLIYIYT